MGFTTSIKFNKVESISPIKEITFVSDHCALNWKWFEPVAFAGEIRKKSPQSGTSWEELVATRQTVRHCACKGALSSGRRRMCYTILAEKPVPSCVALGHAVNVCPPNLETRGGEQRKVVHSMHDHFIYIHICMHTLVITACVEVVCQVLGLRKSSGLFVPFGLSRGVIFFILRP